MVNASPRRFVKVATPTAHAGLGVALRQAFAVDRRNSPAEFRDLLALLD